MTINLRRSPNPAITLHTILRYFDRVLLAIALILALSLSGADAAQGAPRLIKPGEATSGVLLLPSRQDGLYVEAPMLASDVEISVSGPIARTRLTQRFENVSDGWIEGIYVFPMPDGAAVDTLKMQIGDRFIEGVIEEKKKAKEIYEAAKREGKKASLLEQERPNIFTNSVANIGPGETVIVQIEYQETVRLDGGTFSLRFPMVVAPRFNPPAQFHSVSFDGGLNGWGGFDPVPDRDRIEPPVSPPDAGPINPVSLSVDIDAGFPLGEIASSYHQIALHRPDERRASLTLAEETVPADRDFELTWKPKRGAIPSAALFKEEIKGEPYYLLMITPPEGEERPAPAREVTFVLDVSGSMGGVSIRQARASLMLALRRLKPQDAFNIITFNSSFAKLYEAPQPADQQTVNHALGYVSALSANGGTMMAPALEAALTQQRSGDGRLRQIVFLTDGAIGNEQQLFETIDRLRGDARIFTVGIGSAPNSFFMSRAAEIGQGTFTHIGDLSQVTDRMTALFAKLESPAVTNIQVAWPDGVAEIWPSPIPDLYKGETLVVAARGNSGAGILEISATTGNAPWKIDVPLQNASARPGVSKLWARRKIASLELGRARRSADYAELDGEILKTALAHHLISRLTSLVAVDVTPSRPAGEALASAEVPLSLPQGWEFEKVFGEEHAPRQREAFAPGLLKTRQASADAATAGPAQGGPGVNLPQGATLADMKLLRGLTLILVAALCFGLLSGRVSFAVPRRK